MDDKDCEVCIYVNEWGEPILPPGPGVNVQPQTRNVDQLQYTTWSNNNSKLLIDLYKKYRDKVGTLQIKSLKKLWEVIAAELNRILMLNLSAQNCENRWRVLDRGYKKFVDNKNKTGRGRKFFEFEEEMQDIFLKKKNIYPEILLSSETVHHQTLPEEESVIMEQSLQSPKSIIKSSRQRQDALTRNKILENMRKDREKYQKERCQIEREKLEIKKEILAELKRRNNLMEERNRLLVGSN